MIHFCFHTVYHRFLKHCSHYRVQILTNNKLLQEHFFGKIFHMKVHLLSYIYQGLRFPCFKIQDVFILAREFQAEKVVKDLVKNFEA